MSRNKPKKIVVRGVKPGAAKPPVSGAMFSGVTDHHGRKYIYMPNAKLPYSRHSILYPDGCEVGDEDIPIQHGHEGAVGINGASPVLLMAAAHTALQYSTSRLPYREIAKAHLQIAIELLKAEEDFLTELQNIETPSVRNSDEVLVLSALHLLKTYEAKSPATRSVICNALHAAELKASDLITDPRKSPAEYRKIITMIQKRAQ